jgi:hypothetical protein
MNGRGGRLLIWMAASLLLHAALLIVPVRFYDTLFPPRGSAEVFPPDLTPGFDRMALFVVDLDGHTGPSGSGAVEEAGLESRTAERETFQRPESGRGVEPPDIPEIPGTDPASRPEMSSTGTRASAAARGVGDDTLFPPVPVLVVPPDLGDLDLDRSSVSLRVLVGPDGKPVEIEMPGAIPDALRERLTESVVRFRFRPAEKEGRPTSAWVDLRITLESE